MLVRSLTTNSCCKKPIAHVYSTLFYAMFHCFIAWIGIIQAGMMCKPVNIHSPKLIYWHMRCRKTVAEECIGQLVLFILKRTENVHFQS